jgi:hypothetical protein
MLKKYELKFNHAGNYEPISIFSGYPKKPLQPFAFLQGMLIPKAPISSPYK